MAKIVICGRCMGYGDASPKSSSTVDDEEEVLCNCCGGNSVERRIGSYLDPNRALVEQLGLISPVKTQRYHTNAERSPPVAKARSVRRRRPASNRDERRSTQSSETNRELNVPSSSVSIESINSTFERPERWTHSSEEEANARRTTDERVPQRQQISPRTKRRIEKFQIRWDANMTNESDFDRMLRNGADSIVTHLTSRTQFGVLDLEDEGQAPGSRGMGTTGGDTRAKEFGRWLPPAQNPKEVPVQETKPAKMMHAGGWVTRRHEPTPKGEKAIVRGKLPRINAGKVISSGRLPRIDAGKPGKVVGSGKLPRISAGRAIRSGKLPRFSAGNTTVRGKISSTHQPRGNADASVWDVEVSEDGE